MAGLVGILAIGAIVRFADGFPIRLGAGRASYEAAKNDGGMTTNVKRQDIHADNLVVLGGASTDAPVSLLLWGDSHAMAIASAVDALCQERGIAGRAAVHVGAPPIQGYVKPGAETPSKDHLLYCDAVLAYVQRHRVRDVILASYWHGHSAFGSPKSKADMENALVATVESLVRAGARPWILLQIPQQPFNVPRVLATVAISGADLAGRCATPGPDDGIFRRSDRTFLERLTAAGAGLLDPRPNFLDPTGRHYVVSIDGVPLYYDSNHLTATGARLMILPLLRSTIDSASPAGTKP